MDGLDVPFVLSLRANFFRDDPYAGRPLPTRDVTGTAGSPAGSFASLEYRNPVTGGPALATLGCLLEGLPAGAATSQVRETASSVMVVAQGAGTLACDGQGFDLQQGDVAAVPAWSWHQLAAGREDLIVFRVTDRPIHDAFGLYLAEKAHSQADSEAVG
jgi:gentisate 1,2-dioxygenase